MKDEIFRREYMKNKNVVISVICIMSALLLAALSLVGIFVSGSNMATVRCVVTDSDSVYMVYHDRLVLLNYKGELDLDTGDKIFVIFNTAFAESYPEQTKAHMIIKVSDGDPEDISLSEEYRELIGELGFVIK